MFVNHYEILGVGEDADLVQITAAWKRLLRKYHPDLNQDNEDATEQTILINKACEVLSDPAKRSRFDKQLKKHREENSSKSATAQSSQEFDPTNNDNSPPPNHSEQFSAQNTGSFANKTRKKSKQRNFATAVTIVGVVLGGATAIPIGLFVVWAISGNDPLGIFRLSEDATAKEDDFDDFSNDVDESSKEAKKQLASVNNNENKTFENPSQTQKGDSDSNNVDQAVSGNSINKQVPAPHSNDKKLVEPKVTETKVTETKDASPETAPVPPTKTPVESRIAIPEENKIVAAKQAITEVFKSDYENANLETGIDRLVKLKLLSKKIIDLLAKENDPVQQYAIFEVSIDVAKQSCFAAESLQMVDDFENRFVVDGMAIRLELIEHWHAQLPKTIKVQAAKRSAFLELAILTKPFTEQVTKNRNWKMAVGFSEKLRKFYIAGGDRDSASKVEKIIPTLKRNLDEELNAIKFLAELNMNPDQAEKQLAVGCYFCFVMDDWQKGLPFLKKSNSQELSNCAAEDLAATLDSSEYVGDLWWELADDKTLKRYQAAIYARAENYYFKAKAKVDSITRAKLEKRIRFISPLPKISIVNARFGWNKKWVDATASLRRILEHDPPVFVNSASGLGVGDPIPKIRKIIKITYTIDGEQKNISLKAGPNRKYNLFEQLK